MKRVVVVGVLTMFLLGATAFFPRGSQCERAANWVAAHAQDLPRTLDEIAAFPRGYRQYIFSAHSPEQKAALWQEQMRRTLERDDLSAEQRAFVLDYSPLIIPAMYRDKLRYPEVEAKARALFRSPEHQDLMILIGAAAPRQLSIRSFLISLTEVFAKNTPVCSCNDGGSCWTHCFVHQGTSCKPPKFNSCDRTEDGCGFWGGCACTAQCCSWDGGSCVEE